MMELPEEARLKYEEAFRIERECDDRAAAERAAVLAQGNRKTRRRKAAKARRAR
jgi:hypothetical protein